MAACQICIFSKMMIRNQQNQFLFLNLVPLFLLLVLRPAQSWHITVATRRNIRQESESPETYPPPTNQLPMLQPHIPGSLRNAGTFWRVISNTFPSRMRTPAYQQSHAVAASRTTRSARASGHSECTRFLPRRTTRW